MATASAFWCATPCSTGKFARTRGIIVTKQIITYTRLVTCRVETPRFAWFVLEMGALIKIPGLYRPGFLSTLFFLTGFIRSAAGSFGGHSFTGSLPKNPNLHFVSFHHRPVIHFNRISPAIIVLTPILTTVNIAFYFQISLGQFSIPPFFFSISTGPVVHAPGQPRALRFRRDSRPYMLLACDFHQYKGKK